MNEFEWRQQMRSLREPVAPRRDLWNAIDVALEDRGEKAVPPPIDPRASTRPWLLAAAVTGAFLLVGNLGLHLHRPASLAAASVPTPAGSTWKPSDPRLSGAAIELDAARIELRQALQQSSSPSLQRLLARTERQQAQLRHLAQEAG